MVDNNKVDWQTVKITEQSDESGATVTCLCLVSCHLVHAMYYQDDTLIYSKHLLHSFFFPVIFYLIVIGVGVGLTMAYLHLLSSFCEMSLCRGLTESVKTMTITLFRVSPFLLFSALDPEEEFNISILWTPSAVAYLNFGFNEI